VHGIESAVGDAYNAIKSVGHGIVGAAKSVLHILSPSQVMAQQVGVPITQGIAQGMVSATPTVVAAAHHVAHAAHHHARHHTTHHHHAAHHHAAHHASGFTHVTFPKLMHVVWEPVQMRELAALIGTEYAKVIAAAQAHSNGLGAGGQINIINGVDSIYGGSLITQQLSWALKQYSLGPIGTH